MQQVPVAPAPPIVEARTTVADDVYKKIALRIVPLVLLAYIVAYIDRVNVGFAKLQFMKDFGFSEAVYGLGAGLFFFGYMFFEVPSNLLLEKIGARKTLSRIMLIWGCISAAMALVTSPTQFYIMRFLLGAAEAGFFPGIILYLSYWFPTSRRARITSTFTIGGALAGVVGSPLSGWLLTLDGLHGLRGWQVLYIYEGIPAVLIGLIVFFYLHDSPASAAWLTPAERTMVESDLAAETKPSHAHGRGSIARLLRDPIFYVLALSYIAVVSGTSTVAFWAPTVYKSLGVQPSTIGILVGLPFAVAVAAMLWIGTSSDRMMERRWHFAAAIAVAGASLCALALGAHSVPITVALITIAASGAWAAVTVFWTIPPTYLDSTEKAAGIALISSVGAIGGFVSPTIVGSVTSATGSVYYGLSVVGAVLILSGVVLLAGVSAAKSVSARV